MDRQKERDLIDSIPKNKINDFIFMHLRNMWAVDGLYFLGIEKQWGTEAATEIDRFVWEVMGKIEARKIKELFDIQETDVPALMKALQFSGWSMDLEDKEVEINQRKGILRNVRCRVQNTRLKNGLSEFGCKPVRFGFLKAFAKEINPAITVTCTVCPPDKHPNDLWCEWVFELEE
jgi:hypothetical protein